MVKARVGRALSISLVENAQDFSEVCGPIRALQGIHQRAAGQLYQGERGNG